MRLVPRFPRLLCFAALASACVPTDDQPQNVPTESPQPPPPPPQVQPQPIPEAPQPAPVPAESAAKPGQLDPGRALASAAPAPSGKPPVRVAMGDQRRLASPALKPPTAQPKEQTPPGLAPPSTALAVPAPVDTPAAAKPPAGPPDSPITGVYYDTFERPELGPEWNPTSPEWRIVGNRLCGQRAKNHPVWLKRKLPLNARIEFDAVSTSADGDLKVEIWGDGKGFAKGVSYNDATSYLAIFGGWKNQFHVLARIDEHAQGRPEVKVSPGGEYKARPVVANTVYHFKVERADGKTVRWFVDDIEIIAFTDPAPLKGEGHEHLGFNDWEVQVCFDNLQITALPGA